MLVYLIIISGTFMADRLSKMWAADFLAAHGTTQVHSLLTLRETYNRGIAFGLLQGVGPLVGWLSIGVLVWLLVYLLRTPEQMWLLRLGLALIIGGAAGNLVDRVLVGAVLDFMQSPLRWGIFNVADLAINSGMILALVGVFVQQSRAADTIEHM